jgi:hypothetical protein
MAGIMATSLCRSFWRFGQAAILAAALAVVAAIPAEAAKKAHPSYFSSVEIRSSNLKPFKKWRCAEAVFPGTEETGQESVL